MSEAPTGTDEERDAKRRAVCTGIHDLPVLGGGPLAGPIASPSIPGNRRIAADQPGFGDMEHPHSRGGAVGAPAKRVGRHQLAQLADQLSARDQAILETVLRFRLARADQLQRLHFHTIATPTGAARVSRRCLQRLVELGLLARTERRVGGAAAGSGAYTYLLTPPGRRACALLAGVGPVSVRGVHEPGRAFHKHTLAITELYLQLVEASRAGTIELIEFEPEPHAWRPTTGGSVLKPDAFVIVATGELEHLSFVEIDLATEGRRTLQTKLTSYLHHHAAGIEQRHHLLFPKVVWLTPTVERSQIIAAVIKTLPHASRPLFTVAPFTNAINALTGGDRP